MGYVYTYTNTFGKNIVQNIIQDTRKNKIIKSMYDEKKDNRIKK